MAHYCEKCGRTMDDKEFYKSKNVEKYPPDGLLNQCKKCITMHVDNWDPETYKWILKEIDVPYIEDEWNTLLDRYGRDAKKITGMTILGKYLSKMKLKQWSKFSWDDTERLEKETRNHKIMLMQQQGYTSEEIDEQLALNRMPEKPTELAPPQTTDVSQFGTFDDGMDDEINDSLTEEDKIYLRLKWGKGYRPDEWVRLEQFYNDMMNSYDIQTAGHKDTLIMLCKASLRANQLIDIGDIDGFQKAQRAYESLMKSGNFTAAQNKEDNGEAVDSIGELVAMCERDGFIPRYYAEKPKDKVDRVLQDMQRYTYDLVTQEIGLETLVQNSLKSIEQERERIEAAAANAEDLAAKEEDDMFNYDINVLEDEDFKEFSELLDVGEEDLI